MKMIFHSHVYKTLFRNKGFALSLVLKLGNAYFIATIPENNNYNKLYWQDYNKYSIPKAFHYWLLIRQSIIKVT